MLMTKPTAKSLRESKQNLETLNGVFSALADPVRREILAMLDGDELLVSEIAAPFNISIQAVSKHIQVLVKVGLIGQERTGRVSLCRLDAGPISDAAAWINQYSKYWQNQFNTLVAFLPDIKNENEEK